MQETIQFILNRKSLQVTTDSSRKLLWVLRTDLGLTGTKYGCGKGLCGACTVLVNHQAVRSCILNLKNVAGKEVLTIEGFATDKKLHPIQKAFMEIEAFQCGYCTAGMILKAYSLLREIPNPTYAEIIQAMDRNLCRCGSHMRIVQAIQNAAKELRGE